jgi:hypothetical protein
MMKTWWLIVAAFDAWERLGKQFQDRRVSWETWVGLALPFVLIVGLLAFFKWWTGRGGLRLRTGPWALFRELASAHQLTWAERRLLIRLAKTGRVSHPAHVFIDPAVYQNKESARQLATYWPRVLALRDKLFG